VKNSTLDLKRTSQNISVTPVVFGGDLNDIPGNDTKVYDLVKAFSHEHLLHWLEVMSLLKAVDYDFTAA